MHMDAYCTPHLMYQWRWRAHESSSFLFLVRLCCTSFALDQTVKGEVIVLNIRFHGSPITMTAATLPMLYLWLNRYSVETLGLWLSHLIDCGDPAMSKNPDKCCTNHVVIHKVYTLEGLAWLSCNVSALLFGRWSCDVMWCAIVQ